MVFFLGFHFCFCYFSVQEAGESFGHFKTAHSAGSLKGVSSDDKIHGGIVAFCPLNLALIFFFCNFHPISRGSHPGTATRHHISTTVQFSLIFYAGCGKMMVSFCRVVVKWCSVVVKRWWVSMPGSLLTGNGIIFRKINVCGRVWGPPRTL